MKSGDMDFSSSLRCTQLSVHAYVLYSGVTRSCLRPILIGRVEHIFLASCSFKMQLLTRGNQTLSCLPGCSSFGGASVYQSVSRVSLCSGSDLGHAAPGDPKWTHPRIQGDIEKASTSTQGINATCLPGERQSGTQTYT